MVFFNSKCSVTCGKGVQYRKVACRQERYTELSAYACDPKDRPEDLRPCYAGVSCEEAERNRRTCKFILIKQAAIFYSLSNMGPVCLVLDYERYRYVAAAPYTQWDEAGGGGDRLRGFPRPQ